MMLPIYDRSVKLISQLLIICLATLIMQTTTQEIGSGCKILDQPGICTADEDCSVLRNLVLSKKLHNRDITSCGLTARGEMICCPTDEIKFVERLTPKVSIINAVDNRESVSTTTIATTTTTTRASVIKKPINNDATGPTNERPAVRACRLYEEFAKNEGSAFGPHILNGIPADFGEYPHMAAIGFRSTTGGDQSDNLIYDCGATLIAPRFVLTAAHCVASLNREPEVVRLNFTDFTDPRQQFIEIPINKSSISVPPTYNLGKVYDDIAVIELQYDAPLSRTCRPICLSIDKEPPANENFIVAGWGTWNTSRKSKSNILLKLGLQLQPLSECNKDYSKQKDRRFSNGILESQLCAYDRETDQVKKGDSCQGDSGGPLVQVVDENYKIYRAVGVISAGFHCASDTAGLYTRVSAYLDFIESIVWP